MNRRTTYEKPEGVTFAGGALIALAFAVPLWVAIGLICWAVTS